jgi:hypothetical protein
MVRRHNRVKPSDVQKEAAQSKCRCGALFHPRGYRWTTGAHAWHTRVCQLLSRTNIFHVGAAPVKFQPPVGRRVTAYNFSAARPPGASTFGRRAHRYGKIMAIQQRHMAVILIGSLATVPGACKKALPHQPAMQFHSG